MAATTTKWERSHETGGHDTGAGAASSVCCPVTGAGSPETESDWIAHLARFCLGGAEPLLEVRQPQLYVPGMN